MSSLRDLIERAKKNNWKDVADDGIEANIAATIADHIERDIEKKEGFVLIDIDTDMYVCATDRGGSSKVSWDEEDFTLFCDEEIGEIQKMFYDSVNTPTVARIIVIYRNLEAIRPHIRVVPCVMYPGEAAKLDFINAYEFDWD